MGSLAGHSFFFSSTFSHIILSPLRLSHVRTHALNCLPSPIRLLPLGEGFPSTKDEGEKRRRGWGGGLLKMKKKTPQWKQSQTYCFHPNPICLFVTEQEGKKSFDGGNGLNSVRITPSPQFIMDNLSIRWRGGGCKCRPKRHPLSRNTSHHNPAATSHADIQSSCNDRRTGELCCSYTPDTRWGGAARTLSSCANANCSPEDIYLWKCPLKLL